MNIALIGFRASGKTTISRCLGEATGWRCVNTDSAVENLFKQKIPALVDQYGWHTFREYESKVIKKVSTRNNTILDLGGGAILDPDNIKHIKKNAIIVFLDCSPEVLAGRLRQSYYRPPLTPFAGEDEIRKVLKERLDLYSGCCDLVVNTAKRSPEETTLFIITQLIQKPEWQFKYTYRSGDYAFA